MKKNFPSLIIFLILFGYASTIIGAFLFGGYILLYGLTGIGFYFGPIALVSLLVYRFGVFDYDKVYFKKAIIFVSGSFLITGLTMLLLSGSLNINMI